MGLIGMVVAGLLVTGCTGGATKTKCRADSASPPPSSCIPIAHETTESRPTFQTIEKDLEAHEYSRTTGAGIYPASWTKDDTTVVVDKDLTGSVEVIFPNQGKVRCTHLGGEPSGPNPQRLASELKAKGFGLARTTLGCSGL